MRGASVEELVAAYDWDFRAEMTVDDITNSVALSEAVDALTGSSQALAETLLVGVGPGGVVPERLHDQVAKNGDALWRMGLLLPLAAPGPGSTIDPRHYAASCKVNGYLTSVRLFGDIRGHNGLRPHPPASDTGWDAIVVAATIEKEQPQITREGLIRKDVERRILGTLGPDEHRWRLALEMAKLTGLCRAAGRRLYGFPESNPRPLTDPVTLLQGDVALAGAALLRIVDEDWIRLDDLLEVLQGRCPEVLQSDPVQAWSDAEAAWFREAADVFHRAGVLDATRGATGVEAIRTVTPRPARPPGFILTPDRDILIAPWELPGPEYGRLCRLAPFQDGDVVHRHHLQSEGITADLANGYDDAAAFLESRSRTGVPSNVRANLDHWAQSAVRITIFTGVTVLESPDGSLQVTPDGIPPDARMLYYDEPPPARFRVDDGEVVVPFGEDALTVRATVARLGTKRSSEDGHRYTLSPTALEDPDHLLDQLRRYHDGPLPGELEATVHSAAGRSQCRVESAVVATFPVEAVDALRRDCVLAPFLERALPGGQVVVDAAVLGAVKERLAELGFQVDDGVGEAANS